MPKGLKARKHVTSRIVTKEDVENVLLAIRQTYEEEEIDHHHYLSYRAIVLLGAFTGQRPQATIARLLVGQFRNAIGLENRCSIFCQSKTRYACNITARCIRM